MGIWSLLGVLFTIFVLCTQLLRQRLRKWPPGPPYHWPIIGHLPLREDNPHIRFWELSKVYGPLFFLRLGSMPYLIVSSPGVAKEILRTYDHIFASKPPTSAGLYLSFNFSGIAWNPFGPYWRFVRKLCVREVLCSKRLETFKSLRTEEVSHMISSVLQDARLRKESKVIEKCKTMVANMMCSMAIGKRYSESPTGLDGKTQNILGLMRESLSVAGKVIIGDYIPYVKWMDIQGYEGRLRNMGQRLSDAFQVIVDERRLQRKACSDSTSEKDLLDVLLSISEDQEKHAIKLTDDCIKAIFLEIFGGGTDTAAVTSEWALTELLRQPAVMSKVEEELDAVVGRERILEEPDLGNLPYLRAVIYETLRLHPPVPLLHHESMEASTVAGYKIPAKTRVLVNVWAIGRDEGVWERAEEFWPERWVKKDMAEEERMCNYLPFGTGRRGCPGKTIGILTVQLQLGNLLHRFKWSLPEGQKPERLDMAEHYSIMLPRANPLRAVATPRLSPMLFQDVCSTTP